MSKHGDILYFIRLIRCSSPYMMRKIFTEGGCYRFHLILKQVFPGATPWQTQDEGHVLTRIGGHFYDILGEWDGEPPKPLTKDRDIKGFIACSFDELGHLVKAAKDIKDWYL